MRLRRRLPGQRVACAARRGRAAVLVSHLAAKGGDRDYVVNAVGAKGIGEIGLTAMAAAITDAVHHATGVPELPVKMEHLLG